MVQVKAPLQGVIFDKMLTLSIAVKMTFLKFYLVKYLFDFLFLVGFVSNDIVL